jgi:hypothetical protein
MSHDPIIILILILVSTAQCFFITFLMRQVKFLWLAIGFLQHDKLDKES